MMVNNERKALIDPIILGKIGSCYGIYGWLRVSSFTEKKESILKYQPWFVQKTNEWWQVELESWCYHNKDIIIKLKKVDDRNAASLLTNHKIAVNFSQLPKLRKGYYYWRDIINCQVTTINGYQLGTVIYILETRFNDILVIKANLNDSFSKRIRLIPFIYKNIIKKVNLATKIITVDWDPSF